MIIPITCETLTIHFSSFIGFTQTDAIALLITIAISICCASFRERSQGFLKISITHRLSVIVRATLTHRSQDSCSSLTRSYDWASRIHRKWSIWRHGVEFLTSVASLSWFLNASCISITHSGIWCITSITVVFVGSTYGINTSWSSSTLILILARFANGFDLTSSQSCWGSWSSSWFTISTDTIWICVGGRSSSHQETGLAYIKIIIAGVWIFFLQVSVSLTFY